MNNMAKTTAIFSSKSADQGFTASLDLQDGKVINQIIDQSNKWLDEWYGEYCFYSFLKDSLRNGDIE